METPSLEELNRYEKKWIAELKQQHEWSQFLATATTKEELASQIEEVKETVKKIKHGGSESYVAAEQDIIFKINSLCVLNGDAEYGLIYNILRSYIYSARGIKLDAQCSPIIPNKEKVMECIEYERQILRVGKDVVTSEKGRRFFLRAHEELGAKLINSMM